MKISILMAVHGDSPFLSQTLSSLEPNLGEDTELIVIFDRASQQVECQVERFSSIHERVVQISSTRTGLPAALNLGLEAAQGEYVARIDADDVLLPGRLQKQSRTLEKHRKLVAVGCQIVFIDEQGNHNGVSSLPIFSWQCAAELELWNPFAHPAMMFRKLAVQQIGGYDEKMIVAQDFDLWRRLRSEGALCNLSLIGTLYRVHSHQSSSTQLSNRVPLIAEMLQKSGGRSIDMAFAERIVTLYSNRKGRLPMLKALMLFSTRRPLTGLIILVSKTVTFATKIISARLIKKLSTGDEWLPGTRPQI